MLTRWLSFPCPEGATPPTVTRIGDTVHRSRGTGSAFAASLLSHLNSIGFPYAPKYLGMDASGRDVLGYVPGNTTDHPSQRAAGAYAAGGRMLRALHDRTAGHPLAGAAECVVHGDPGPFNTIFQRGMPVAFIDWDSSRPGSVLSDLGYMSWTWCVQAAGNVSLPDQARHLRQLRDGYGQMDPDALLSAMVESQTRIARLENSVLRDDRTDPKRRVWAQEAIEWAVTDREVVRANYRLFRAALD